MRTSFNRIAVCSLLVLAVAAFAHAPAKAAIGGPYDTPTLECVPNAQGENSVDLKITAGGSGAPAGITVQWMKYDDYVANGNQWLPSEDPNLCALSLSGQPSYNGNNPTVRWELGPNGFVVITIGAIDFDETGVSGHNCALSDLDCGTTYIFRVFAHATNEHKRSDFSDGTLCSTLDCPVGDCTFTQGYWKTHGPVTQCQAGNNTNAWPLSGLTLGTRAYTDAELCTIFWMHPNNGNCLVKLAHQLIAAKLNIANGAVCRAAADAIRAADLLIDGKNILVDGVFKDGCGPYNSLNDILDQFNNGKLAGCPAHCGTDPCPDPSNPDCSDLKTGATPLAPAPTQKASWGSLKAHYR